MLYIFFLLLIDSVLKIGNRKSTGGHKFKFRASRMPLLCSDWYVHANGHARSVAAAAVLEVLAAGPAARRAAAEAEPNCRRRAG
jgi:hypothetical protein